MKKLILFAVWLGLAAPAYAVNPQVVFKTSAGCITLELYPSAAPKTVENFLDYVLDDFYKGTIFHRVINRFVVQGGGYSPDLTRKETRPAIVNEAINGMTNEPGTVAMARALDPNSATSQFYINLDSNKFLNYYPQFPHIAGYTVFGKVIKGLDVVKKIAAVPTGPAGPFASDVPIEPVVIEDAFIIAGTYSPLPKPISAPPAPNPDSGQPSASPSDKSAMETPAGVTNAPRPSPPTPRPETALPQVESETPASQHYKAPSNLEISPALSAPRSRSDNPPTKEAP